MPGIDSTNPDSTDLKAHLKQLQTTLSQADVDEELRLLLAELDGDIRVLLEQRSAPEEAVPPQLPPADPANLAERTQEISARFAAQHPKLEPTLRELGNMLANMGI
jgi:hypothetical protein